LARPTRAEIIQTLQDLALGQVDPDAWIRGTLPEILRVGIVGPRLAPIVDRTTFLNVPFTSAVNTFQKIAIFTAVDDEVSIIRHLTIESITANIARYQLLMANGFTINKMFEWEPSPPGAQMEIGTDNVATQAWGASGLDEIRVWGRDSNFAPFNQQLEVSIESSVAAVKTTNIFAQVDIYKILNFPGF